MNNRFGLLSIALVLLHLSPGIVHADRCTGDQILQMMDQGFTKEEVMKLCGPAEEMPPEAPEPPDQASLASLAGTWEGHRVDGAFIRYAIFPDGKFGAVPLSREELFLGLIRISNQEEMVPDEH